MVARRKCAGSDDVVVELPDGTRCALPAWMVDAGMCAGVRDSAIAVISRVALRVLRRLVDSQSLLAHASSGEPEGLSTGGAHAPRDKAASASLRKEGPMGGSSGGEAGAVPEAAKPASGGGGDGRVENKEGEQ